MRQVWPLTSAGLAYALQVRVDMRSGASLSSHHRRGISTQRVLDVRFDE